MLTDPSVPERDRTYGRLVLAAWRLADARDAAEPSRTETA
jgi:hypothetical protein